MTTSKRYDWNVTVESTQELVRQCWDQIGEGLCPNLKKPEKGYVNDNGVFETGYKSPEMYGDNVET